MEAIYSTFEEAEEILLEEEEDTVRFIFTRHGRTHLNVERIFQPWTPEGDHLNPEGMTSAMDLGKKLNRVPIRKIYSSDWHRVIHTAQLINEERNPPLREIHLLRSLRDFNFGILCGMSVTEADSQHPELSETRKNNLHKFEAPGGDTFAGFHDRTKEELARIIGENSMGNILVVSHAYVAKCLIIAALDLPLDEHANKINIKNTSISIIELKGRKIPGKLLVLNNR
ncbi:MAG: histidine phosphatase family protein [Candidatus Scalindua rubra]|uniref:Phosphoserine phosphatase 1 n=1 Tax=Candidatus Scalindua brodae TaxID=237368 RepID=A0A0B0EP24_9BACT|nr:MAG: Phosphoserine phosphatase 1 [Candidatus Scalindua brodae]MBZ0109750.1 histidine phosphatase family protein [Candidatus Scalindua rubra]TWU32377.1 Phosphoserine phosphatase 1 [Candidatus Brocadiaceae bacterium S225]